jgi:hypothetical protein
VISAGCYGVAVATGCGSGTAVVSVAPFCSAFFLLVFTAFLALADRYSRIF